MRSLIIRAAALLSIAFDAAAVCAMLGAGWLVGLYEQWRLAAGLACLGIHACVAGFAAVQARRRPAKALAGLGISFVWFDLSVLLAFKLVFPTGLHDSSESWRSAATGWFTLVVCAIALIAIGTLVAAWSTARRKDGMHNSALRS